MLIKRTTTRRAAPASEVYRGGGVGMASSTLLKLFRKVGLLLSQHSQAKH